MTNRTSRRKILLLAGEESGALYAEGIASAVRRTAPNTEIRGYGDYGFEISDLAVMGIGQVLKQIFYFIRVKRTMEKAIDEWKPDVVCTIDYPGMNLKLATYAKTRGIRAVHVVCPQVWAWKQGRIPKIETAIDRLCCFFPFEPALFRPGFAEFIGHPLAAAFVKREYAPREPSLLAVLPGSRLGEIEKILPTLLIALDKLRLRFKDLKVMIPAANERAKAAIERLLASSAVGKCCEVTLGGARELLSRAECAVVASGTATLEAALAGCPTLLVYRVGWLFAFLARRFIVGVKHIGLANVIAEKSALECPMPELLQEDFTAPAVEAQLTKWLSDETARATTAAKLAAVTALLKDNGDPLDKIARSLT